MHHPACTGLIEINPGNPAVPNAIALTLKKAIYAKPIPDPTIHQ